MSAPLSFESFCADLLPAWQSDEPIAADTHASSAKAAAKLAVYRAALAEGKGTVLVIASAGEQKAVQGYITAMVESQPMLKGMDKAIEVCPPERAPLVKEPTHIIQLAAQDALTIAVDMNPVDLARSIAFAFALAKYKGDRTLALQIVKLLKRDDQTAEQYVDERVAEITERTEQFDDPEWRKKMLTPPTYGSSLDGVPTQPPATPRPQFDDAGNRLTEDGYYPAEFEASNAERKTRIVPHQQERALTKYWGSAREQARR